MQGLVDLGSIEGRQSQYGSSTDRRPVGRRPQDRSQPCVVADGAEGSHGGFAHQRIGMVLGHAHQRSDGTGLEVGALGSFSQGPGRDLHDEVICVIEEGDQVDVGPVSGLGDGPSAHHGFGVVESPPQIVTGERTETPERTDC